MPILEIDGRRVEIDEGFLSMSPELQNQTVDEIAASLGSTPADAAQSLPQTSQQSVETTPTAEVPAWDQAGPSGIPGSAIEDATPSLPDNSGASVPVYLGQRANRALADIAGAPIDLSTMALNAGLSLADLAARPFGSSVDARVPGNGPGSSDWIADNVASAYEGAGGTVVGKDEVSPGVQLAGEAVRYGTGAALPSMALAGGGKQAAQAVGGAGGRVLDVLSDAYRGNAAKQIIGDTAAGAGSGVGMESYDDFMPQSAQDAIGPLGKILAAIVGGVGGGTVAAIGGAGANGLRAKYEGMTTKPDPSTPIDGATGLPYAGRDMDMAARIAQNQPTNLAQAVDNIDTNQRDFQQFASRSEMPTTGMMADDIGMALQERTARTKEAQRFAERDSARNSLADQRIDDTVPRGADGRAMVDAATRQYDDTLASARQSVEGARGKAAAADADLARQNADLREFGVRQGEASAGLDDAYRTAQRAGQTEKNARYDAIPDETPVSGQRLYEEMQAIEGSVPRAARSSTEYANTSYRIRELLNEVDPATGDTKIRDITYGDAKVLKAEVSALRKEAVAAGRDVGYLDKINSMLSGVIDEVNPEAARYYREEYAPKFKTGRAGEYTAAMKRAVRTGEESSGTRPTEFGGKMLTKPEDAAALQRAIDVNGNPVTAENATKWMLGDLAKSNVLTDKAEVRFDRFKSWANKNKAVIDQFPDMRRRVDDELSRAEQGGRLSKNLAKDVLDAETQLEKTGTDLRRSALHKVLDAEPKKAISAIMEGRNPPAQMAELAARLKGDQKATDGLKAATRDWIRGKVRTTARNVGNADSEKISRAKLDTLFSDHENTLAKVYSPEEMNALRQAHKLTDIVANIDVRASAGSESFEKFLAANKDTVNKRWRMAEAALKAKYGMLKGGGAFRTLRLFVDALPNDTKSVENILFEMHFNPDLAKHLLTRNVREIGTPAWNGKLNRLIAAASGNRDADNVDTNDEKRTTKEVSP